MLLQLYPALPRAPVPVLCMHSCTGHKELKLRVCLLYESLLSLVLLAVMDFQRAKRSFVWAHFARKGKDSARCKLCHKDFAHHGATTNLKEHLRRIHKEVFSEDTSSTQSQSKISQAGTKPIENFGNLSSSRVCPACRTCSNQHRLRLLQIGWLTAWAR